MADLMAQRLPRRIKRLFRQVGDLAEELSSREGVRQAEGPACNVYAVGGLPRDLILNRPNWDVDIVVEGDGIAFAKAFVELHGGRVVPHKRFQTAIMVLPDGFKIDVATARIEHYERPAALPVVEPSVIKHDLCRRDFTINSMAVQLNTDQYGKLVDYFGGRRDLKLGVVRVLHNLSLVEDPTRILRAVRFEQRYGFRIDQKTEHLLRQAVEARVLDEVKGQRVRDELILLLKEEEPLRPFMRLEELGALSAIQPGLHIAGASQTLFGRIREVLDWFALLYLDEPMDRWIVYLLALLEPLDRRGKLKLHRTLIFPKKAWAAVEALGAHGRRINTILGSKKDLRASEIYAACHELSGEVLLFLMAHAADDRVKRRVSLYFDRLHRTRTQITGRDLAALGVPQGPIYRRIKDQVLAAKLDGEVATKEEELALAKRLWEDREGA